MPDQGDMTIRRGFIALVSSVLLYASCAKNDNPVSSQTSGNVLSGNVIDPGGNLVQGVGVHYIFTTRSLIPLAKPGETCPSTAIGYSISAPGHVLLRILRWYTREPVDTLVDGMQPAGNYRVSFDAARLTNGVYLYQLVTDSATAEQHILLLNTDVSSLVQASPLATSDARGTFSLPYGMFGFGVVSYLTSSGGPTVIDSVCISTSIQLVFYKEGYQTLIQPVVIDTTQAISRTFTLSR